MRKSINRFVLLLLYFLSLGVPAFSQDTTLNGVKAQLDLMFAGLDKTKVPTGFLWDTAVNRVEREDYNGVALTDSNYVSLSVMEDLLYSINSASVGVDTIGVQAALARLQRNSSSTTHSVGILFQPYNYIVENALTDNLIVYTNDLVSDSYISGVWQNPYSEDVLFGYAIGEELSVSLNATFVFTNIDSLSTRSFQSIQFDPGDGGGFRTLSFGNFIAANYSEAGYHLTKLKVSYGGVEYQSHGYVFVENNTSTQNTMSFSDYISTEKTAVYNGQTYKCRVTYKKFDGFNNPLIVAEGFDPWKFENNPSSTYEGHTHLSDILSYSTEYNVDAFAFFGNYDIFYIDWYDCGADIRANAEVLKTVIRWVNENKTSGNKNIVLGQSMGGLIARYALRDMELNHEAHETKLFISHDVPYKGANVSPGLMYLYWDLYDITNNVLGLLYSLFGEKMEAGNELMCFGSYTSVKQMVTNYVNESWSYNTLVFDQFQEELYNMGFPQGDPGYPIDNIAIINGGNASSGSPSLFSSGNKLVDIYLKVSSGIISELLAVWPALLLSGTTSNYPELFLPGKSTLRFNYSVYPYLSNSSQLVSSSLVFTKKFLWLIDKDYVLKSSSFYSPSTGVPLDAVRSSYYEIPTKLTNIIPDPNSNNNVWWGGYEYSFDVTDRIAFIPTASAFASTDYGRDFRTNHPAPKIDTPFTSYIMPDTTTYHTSFYGGIAHWLDTVEGMSIDGPLMPESGDAYSMPSGYTSSFSWSTSASNIASVSSTGVLTVSGNGLVDIIARKDSATYVVSKRKTVLAGLPRMALSSNHSGTQYSVRAECIDDGVEDFLSRTHLTDSIMRKWYLVVGGERIDSTFNYKDTASFTVADSIRIASVTLFLNYNGRISDPVHYVIKEKRSYIWNVQSIWRMEDGAHYFLNVRFRPDNDNPPFFKMKSNPLETNTPLPAKLKATAGNTILRTTGDLEIVNGVVIWDLFTETAVLSLINLAYRTDQVKQLIIEVYSDMEETDATLVQTIVIPIHPVVPPIPLEM